MIKTKKATLRKLHVLLLNYEYPPLGGGAANATRQLLLEFAQMQAVAVDLVTSSPDSEIDVERLSPDITIHRLPVNKKGMHYWRQREVLAYLFRARKYIHAHLPLSQYDLAHAFFALPSGLLCYRHRDTLPYIVSLRGSDVPGFNKRLKLHYSFLKPLVRRVWSGASSVIANSDDLRSLALGTSPLQRVDVIANGVDTKSFQPRRGDRRRHGPLRILAVSRLIERKGLDILIRALPEILEHRDVSLQIVGGGNLKEPLRKLVADLGVTDAVTMTGYVPHERLPEIYSDADLFVLPSHAEGMSNALLEAMACGLPVIATDTGGSSALLHGNGLVVEENTPSAWSEAILVTASDEAAMRAMAETSRSIAQRHSWTGVARQYLDIYAQVANSPDTPCNSKKAASELTLSHQG